jgi:hypothetical protein
MTPVTGYLHPQYAQSLAEFGQPRALPNAGGWILEQRIPDTSAFDATGCYPLFTCQNWHQLDLDLEELSSDLIALSLVTDPFGDFARAHLQRWFPDLVVPFKEHLVVDLSRPLTTFVSPHHQRYARKALQQLHVERCKEPMQFLDDWMHCYQTLIERHHIQGIRAFSRAAFAQQLAVPGLVMFRAVFDCATVGMLLWYVQDTVGYYHLGAFTPVGYKQRSSFALFWSAFEYFADHGLQWLNLGAGAGLTKLSTDGLTQFKRGWSTGTRTAYFCGRIFKPATYAEIVQARGGATDGYFPAYRGP